MHSFRKTVIIAFSSLFLMTNVNAVTCNYEEKAILNNEVVNLKTNYEIKERTLDKSEYDVPDAIIGTEYEDSYEAVIEYLQVNFLNLTENMYVEVTNDLNDEVKVYRYSDTSDGNFSFNWENVKNLVTITFKVYASSVTGCEGFLLKTITLKLPRYNDYSLYSVCNNFSDYYLCQKFVTYEDVDYGSFMTKMRSMVEKKMEKEQEQEEKEKNKKWYEKVEDFIEDNKVPFIIGGGVLIVAAGCATYIIIKKRRRSKI